MNALLISAGGTGGGTYPALAVAEVLHATPNPPALHYIGSIGGMEAGLVAKTPGLFASYDAIHAGPLNGVSIPRRVASLGKIALGILETLRLIGKYKPSALFLTGGFVTFPVAVACWLRRLPTAIYLPDIEPGQAIKATAALASVIYVTTNESDKYFRPGKTVETGYPLRADVLRATRADGLAQFGLDPNRRTLLITGGSRGSRSINTAIIAGLPELLADGLQIIHVSGELDWPGVQAARDSLSAPQQTDYHTFPYLHGTMGLAMAASDLAICRAGASALGELPLFGLPAILVPYPYAWRYQKVNADWLVTRGAALRLDDGEMSARLIPNVRELFNTPGRLNSMRNAAHALARPDGAENIAKSLLNLSK